MVRTFLKLFNKLYYLVFKGSRTGLRKRTLAVAIFSIAMAYLEAAVVVYLRALYFPDAFQPPFQTFQGLHLYVELGREFSTIIMLMCIGYLMGRRFQDRFAFFMFSFGLWDIFYYVWLKVFLNWPESLLSWDLLFLIPLPWSGPVLAPILVSISLVIAAVITIYYKEKGIPVHLRLIKWVLEALAGTIIIIAFLWNYENILAQRPITYFPWWLFFTGLTLGWGVFISEVIRIKRLHIPEY